MTHSPDFSSGARPLDRDHAPALWAQLESELRRRIDLGHFAQRFPTDRELVEIYGVSRHTARHAVGRLEADGMLRRARGIGSSVDHDTMTRSLGSLYSLFQLVEGAGIPQHSEVRFIGEVRDATAAEHLGQPENAPLIYLDRLRWAGDQPLARDQVWLPSSVARPLLDADLTRTSLYDELDRHVGRRPNDGWERIRAALAGPADAAALNLAPASAVFDLERFGSHDGEPLEWRTTVIRSDRLCFVADWSVGQRSELHFQMTRPTGTSDSADPVARSDRLSSAADRQQDASPARRDAGEAHGKHR